MTISSEQATARAEPMKPGNIKDSVIPLARLPNWRGYYLANGVRNGGCKLLVPLVLPVYITRIADAQVFEPTVAAR
jgi:hypothetical protein